MRRTPAAPALALAALLQALAPGHAPAADGELKLPLELSAIAEVTGGFSSGTRQLGVTLRITHLTPREEVWRLAGLVATSGQDALRAALAGRSDGLLRLGTLDFPLSLAVGRPGADGHELMVVTARPLRLGDGTAEDRSPGYPFGVMAFRIDDFGNGDGVVYQAAQISIDPAGALVIENFQEEPGLLKEIRAKR